MTEGASGGAKTRGQSPSTRGQTIAVRMRPDQLADIDAWIATRAHPMSRPEAIRQLALAKARRELDGGD